MLQQRTRKFLELIRCKKKNVTILVPINPYYSTCYATALNKWHIKTENMKRLFSSYTQQYNSLKLKTLRYTNSTQKP